MRELTLSEERERLARDLHDTVIQRLFGVGLALQIALPKIDDDVVRERINNVLDELDATIHEIRTTIFEIDQDRLSGVKFEERVKALSAEIETRLGVLADVDVIGRHRRQCWTPGARNTACRRYERSSPTSFDTRTPPRSMSASTRVGDLIEIVVSDNGVGFTPNVGSGRGVRNLTSRARELGGNCTIKSKIGGGTTVRWTAQRKV